MWVVATGFEVEEDVRVQTLWLGNQSQQERRARQSAREVTRVDKERRSGSKLRSSSEAKSELRVT